MGRRCAAPRLVFFGTFVMKRAARLELDCDKAEPGHEIIRRMVSRTDRQRRVLELGAGTGLLSITASQIFSRTSLRVSIKTTNYHPSVLENLAQNLRQNRSAVRVFVDKLDRCALVKEVGGYDVVLAADVVYHPGHA
ncbi:hypothetical protein JVU11DRAFT_4613 [Chiua virens]|nr:hypothetical protein JVU11DRAFT_4613 [Chiua virens]